MNARLNNQNSPTHKKTIEYQFQTSTWTTIQLDKATSIMLYKKGIITLKDNDKIQKLVRNRM